VTTKALPDITDGARDIEPLVCKAEKRKSAIVLIQNGVGIKKAHRTRFPRNPVISAVTIVSAEQTSHSVVRRNRRTKISFKPYSDGLGGKTPESQDLVRREVSPSTASYEIQRSSTR
jgi:2-dehydropantoate 2-reductase